MESQSKTIEPSEYNARFYFLSTKRGIVCSVLKTDLISRSSKWLNKLNG